MEDIICELVLKKYGICAHCGKWTQHRDSGGHPSTLPGSTLPSLSLHEFILLRAALPSLDPILMAVNEILCTGPLTGCLDF